jgi:Transcriptional regulator, AbiEi antitoxin
MAEKLGSAVRERAIVDLAARQRGLLTGAQLRSLDVGRRTVDRWLASGRLQAVHRDVYAFGPQPLNKRGKWLAAVLAMGPGAFLSHESAAALWGLSGDTRKVHVNAPRGRQVRPGRVGIQVHR